MRKMTCGSGGGGGDDACGSGCPGAAKKKKACGTSGGGLRRSRARGRGEEKGLRLGRTGRRRQRQRLPLGSVVGDSLRLKAGGKRKRGQGLRLHGKEVAISGNLLGQKAAPSYTVGRWLWRAAQGGGDWG